jgi:hypothetical protein
VLGVVVIAACAAPAAQALDIGTELVEVPDSVERPEVVQIEWIGEAQAQPRVFVERRHSLRWVTQAREDSDGVVVDDLGGGLWSARWQPSFYSPSGLHRIRVEGADYALSSEEFRVKPCRCVIPHPVRVRWRDGRFLLTTTAEYAAKPDGGFRMLPQEVTSGHGVVRVWRDGRRVGSALLNYRDGKFRGTWPSMRGPRDAMVFQLVSLADAFGNS